MVSEEYSWREMIIKRGNDRQYNDSTLSKVT